MSNPGSCLKEYYEGSIEENLDIIKFIHATNGVFQGVRERNQNSWKIVELCREILFDNGKWVQALMEKIEDGRNEIKKLGRV